MNTPLDEPHRIRDRELFRRLVDQRLTAEQFADVEQRLLNDADFRAHYVQFMDLEASLYDELITGGLTNQAVSPAKRQQLPWWKSKSFLGWSALVSVMLAVLVYAGYGLWPDRQGAGYVEIPLQGIETAAIVTHVQGLGPQPKGRELKPGMRMKPGSLVLDKGRVQIEFLGGAKLLVQGPCELHILSRKSATLVSGEAATRVLEWGRGFVLHTPEAVMVDLGTEFAVGVDEQQGSEVQVVDGEVEVSVLGEDGSTLTSERVEEAGAVRIRPGATTFIPSVVSRRPPLKVLDEPPRPLSVPESYVRTVLQAKPTIYWRFHSLEANLVHNEVGPQYDARLELPSDATPPIRFTGGHVVFEQSTGPRYLTTVEPVPKLNAESFSIEFWVNPAMLHWATLVGIVPEGDDKAVNHLNVIELAHQTFLVHEPGAFRFMHRHPPTATGGVNLFTPTGCTPGWWHHVVAVKTPNELKLYLNGHLARRIAGTMGSDDAPYQLLVGELHTSKPVRQFVGSIDELALYLHALNDVEIERHYRLLAVGSAE